VSEAPEEIAWSGKWITAKRRGKWEYVSRARGIRAAVIVAIDDDDHVLLVDQYRVPLGKRCLELPAGSATSPGMRAMARLKPRAAS
jgi:ADP-ribose pyrophosphatase